MARQRHHCAACEEPLAAMHHPGCRILLLASARRVGTTFVTREDTDRTNCGCPALLVRQFGEAGHRSDDRKAPVHRPPLLDRQGRVLVFGVLVAVVTMLVTASQIADLGLDRSAIALRLCAGGVTGIAVTTLARLHGARLPVWPGMRVVEHGEPGRIVRCPHCTGVGVLFAPAYPPLPGPRTYQRTR